MITCVWFLGHLVNDHAEVHTFSGLALGSSVTAHTTNTGITWCSFDA